MLHTRGLPGAPHFMSWVGCVIFWGRVGGGAALKGLTLVRRRRHFSLSLPEHGLLVARNLLLNSRPSDGKHAKVTGTPQGMPRDEVGPVRFSPQPPIQLQLALSVYKWTLEGVHMETPNLHFLLRVVMKLTQLVPRCFKMATRWPKMVPRSPKMNPR